MTSYARSAGWKTGTYHTAIGIRADEIDRVNANWIKEKLIYPLACAGVTKSDVALFWDRQPFKLQTQEHRGNCEFCWKKSPRKLAQVLREKPDAADFFLAMEEKHTGRQFMRKSIPMADFVKQIANLPVYSPSTDAQIPLIDIDIGQGCDESCEVL